MFGTITDCTTAQTVTYDYQEFATRCGGKK